MTIDTLSGADTRHAPIAVPDPAPTSAWAQRLEAMEPNMLRDWLRPRMLAFVRQAQREQCVPGEVEVDHFLCKLVQELQDSR